MKTWVKIALHALSTLAILGCRAKKEDNNGAQFGIADLVGTWSVDCVPSQFGQISGYRMATLQINDSGNFIYQSSHYRDDKCTANYYEESSQGSFTIGDAVDAFGKRVTIAGTIGTGTARDLVFVNAANDLGICGYQNWVKDQPQNLMGTGCIGWSETNSTDGIGLIDTSDGKKQIQVFGLSSIGDQQRGAGDDFIKK